MLRGEIPPSNKILCSFISRLHEEHNTTGIVKSHLTRGGISPRWGEIFPYKRNTTGMVRWIESIRWFSLVSSSWFHGRETLLHLTSQPRRWQVRWKISYKQWLKSTSPLSPGSGRWGVFPHINKALERCWVCMGARAPHLCWPLTFFSLIFKSYFWDVTDIHVSMASNLSTGSMTQH